MIIRQASINDLKRILGIARECFGEFEYYDYIEKEIKSSFDLEPIYDICFYVCEVDNKIVSYAGVGESLCLSEIYELRLGATLPEYRNKGIMSKLTEFRIADIKNKLNRRKGMIQVSTKHSNIYSKFGFTEIFENDNEYKHMILLIN